jgi:hypothetical protein
MLFESMLVIDRNVMERSAVSFRFSHRHGSCRKTSLEASLPARFMFQARKRPFCTSPGDLRRRVLALDRRDFAAATVMPNSWETTFAECP